MQITTKASSVLLYNYRSLNDLCSTSVNFFKNIVRGNGLTHLEDLSES